MAYTTIDKPSDYFNTVLYTGDLQDSDGTGHTQSITGVGFTPDWVWHKGRSGARTHILVDSVRGTTNYNWLISNSTSSEITANTNGAIKSIDSDGITLENGNDSSCKSNNAGKNGETWVFWNWLAGGTASSNTDGSITSTVSANTTAGFSIGTYTGTGSATTVGHGLGVAPSMIIVKNRGASSDWRVFHEDVGNTKWLQLNDTSASQTSSTMWNDTSPTSSVFSIGTSGGVNTSSGTYVFYAFTEKKGYSKIGSYTGNGSTDGTFVYTGFKPAFILTKNLGSGHDWWLLDNKRDVDNPTEARLVASSNAEDSAANSHDFLSNGFKCRASNTADVNGNGDTMIYMAFAESPFVTSTGIPTTAR